MGQWEDKLGAILNDPQAMSQIMSLARSLNGGQGQSGQEQDAPGQPEPVEPGPPDPAQAEPQPEPPEAGPASELDPKFMAAGMRALAAWQDQSDSRTQLLQALRPFVKEARQAKVDKAIRVAKLSRVVRAALDGLQGGEADV